MPKAKTFSPDCCPLDGKQECGQIIEGPGGHQCSVAAAIFELVDKAVSANGYDRNEVAKKFTEIISGSRYALLKNFLHHKDCKKCRESVRGKLLAVGFKLKPFGGKLPKELSVGGGEGGLSSVV